MTVCDNCGAEVPLPFACQHCGKKFCADCRLPPNHNCTGIVSWNRKPRPVVGANYTRNGSVAATGGAAMESRGRTGKKAQGQIPYLWIMAGIIGLVVLFFLWLVLTGH